MEYILHRFLMHNENNYYGYNHVHHHKNTDKNMNIININRKEYENKKIEGDNLIFQPKESIILMIVLYCFVYIFYILSPVKLNKYFLILLPLIYSIYGLIMWNSIHPYIHKKCGRNYTIFSLPCNITEYIAKKNSFIQWLIENHKKHHNIKGNNKGNYNITIPGADFMYNTYN